jgi:hypothetical protein
MRALTANERRLGLIFLGMVFVIANLFLAQLLVKKKRLLQRSISQLKAEQQESAAWLTQKDFWLQRKAWLEAKEPKLGNDGQDPARLLESLQQSAERNKVAISQQKLLDVQTTEHYREVAVQLEVKGTLEAVGRWLAELQVPEKFQAVTKLTLQSDAEPSKVICNLVVARWHAIGN